MMQQSWKIDPQFRQEFLDFCELAASDDEVFKSFRENDRIKTIIENNTIAHSDKIVAWLWENKFFITTSDQFTPTEIRYIYTKILTERLFGTPIMGVDIVEIGGGYGGQCAIIHEDRWIKSYTIYDLPQVQKLQARYLKDFNIQPIFPGGIPEAPKHDLLISWCAWSELDLKTRIEYVEKVITKADQFIICSNYNFYEDMGILCSFGIMPKVYSDNLYSNIIYYEK